MIPERVVLALQADGWIIRAKPPWIKPNPMPDSTDDRPNVAHESVFLLTKLPTYYFDMEAVRVPSAASTIERDKHTRITRGKDGAYAVQHDHETPSDPGGRHLRTNDFFTGSLDDLIEHHEGYLAHLKHIRHKGGLLLSEDGDPMVFWNATQSFQGSHFATWPERLVRPMILASTSEKGCCPACGAFWRRDVEHIPSTEGWDHWTGCEHSKGGASRNGGFYDARSKTLGWQPSCSCPTSDPVPCVVLDCFNGSGTTGSVATALGRRYVGTDLNADYLDISRRRITRPHARHARPAAVDDAPLPLFAGLDGES